MKKTILFFTAFILTLQLQATDTFNSEASHFVGGTLLAGISTAVVNEIPQYKQNRAIIGFGISSAYALVDQSIQYAEDGGAGGQLLDLGSHVLGSALGAWLTDKYILTPVAIKSDTEGKYLGLALGYSF